MRNTVMDKFGRKKCDIKNGPKVKARWESTHRQQARVWSADLTLRGNLAEIVNIVERALNLDKPVEFLINLFLAGLGLRCCMQAASGGGEWGTGSGAEEQPLCLSGPVSRGMGESSRTRDRTRVPGTGKRILSHWTTRETHKWDLIPQFHHL